MAKQQSYTVTITAKDDVRITKSLRKLLNQFEESGGIESIVVERNDQEPRDISEVVDILDRRSKEDIEQLRDAIDTYTEEDT